MFFTRKTILSFAVATLITLSNGNVFAQSKLKTEDKKIYDESLTLAAKTNNRAAIDLLRGLYDKYPDNINVAYNLGVCYVNMSGNPDSAIFFLEKVEKLDKSNEWSSGRAELCLVKARAYQLKGEQDKALKLYDEIEKNDTEGEYTELITKEREKTNNAKVIMANPVKLTLHNLGSGVNTKYNDYRPVLTQNEDTIYFTSRRPKDDADKKIIFDDGQYEEGIYYSVRTGNKWDSYEWTDAEQVCGLITDKKGIAGQETATSLASNGNELYLVHDGDIYVSQKDPESGKWNAATALSDTINSVYNEDFAFVTEDGQTMIISSDISGGIGGKDLYIVRRLPNGQWGTPQNMGETINTDGDEDAPFFHEETQVLYFCSTGHNSIGGYDIFYSPMNEKGVFEAAQNIGYPINSPDDELYFMPSQDLNRGYYASIRWDDATSYASYDIYAVEFETPEQDRLAVVAANVEADNLRDVTIYTLNDQNERIGIGHPNSRTGRFVTIVDAGGNYTLEAHYGDQKQVQSVETKKSDSYSVRQNPIQLDTFSFVQKVETPQECAEEDKAATEIAQNTDATSQTTESGFKSWITTDDKPYTVQIMSVRDTVSKDRIQGLDTENIAEYHYTDGWIVYSYGAYATYREAANAQTQIRSTTKYADAFARNANQYKRFIRSAEDTK